MACSCSANETTKIMPPLSWLRAKRGLIIRSFYGCGLLFGQNVRANSLCEYLRAQ